MLKYQIPKPYRHIREKAWTYQDARTDRGHGFIVTIYAQMICDIESTASDIVVPAAILHDIGWSQLSESDRLLEFNKQNLASERLRVRFLHQDLGVKLARGILNDLEYDGEKVDEILEIISEHDTREGFISDNEGAMRDVDKLSRFDDYGFLNDNQISQISFGQHYEYLESCLQKPGFFYFESSRKLALDNLA